MKFILDACEPTVASNISKHDPPTSDRKKAARSLAGPTSFGKSPTGAVCEIGNCIELRNILKQPLLQRPNPLQQFNCCPSAAYAGSNVICCTVSCTCSHVLQVPKAVGNLHSTANSPKPITSWSWLLETFQELTPHTDLFRIEQT